MQRILVADNLIQLDQLEPILPILVCDGMGVSAASIDRRHYIERGCFGLLLSNFFVRGLQVTPDQAFFEQDEAGLEAHGVFTSPLDERRVNCESVDF